MCVYLYSSGVLADGSPEASMVHGLLLAGSHCRPKAGCGELPGDGDVDGPFQGAKNLHEIGLG